jgi:hypothetical protein
VAAAQAKRPQAVAQKKKGRAATSQVPILYSHPQIFRLMQVYIQN